LNHDNYTETPVVIEQVTDAADILVANSKDSKEKTMCV
jgi:hypothetical protein